jgi:hypothetical protein
MTFIIEQYLCNTFACYNADMAVNDIIPERHIVYSNGAVYDKQIHRIVFHRPDLATQNTQITSENASALQARRLEIKRERAREGANRALLALRRKKWDEDTKRWLDDGAEWEDPKDMDYVEAIMEAQAGQALMVGDASSTKAAEFVMAHTGMAEKQQQEQAQQTVTHTLDPDVVSLLQQIAQAQGVPVLGSVVVDAETGDTDDE